MKTQEEYQKINERIAKKIDKDTSFVKWFRCCLFSLPSRGNVDVFASELSRIIKKKEEHIKGLEKGLTRPKNDHLKIVNMILLMVKKYKYHNECLMYIRNADKNDLDFLSQKL